MNNQKMGLHGNTGVPQNVAEASQASSVQTHPTAKPVQADPIADLNALLEIGKVTEEVEVNGFKFTIHTLTADESNAIMKAVRGIEDDVTLAMDFRIVTLAFAVSHVNGVELDKYYKGPDQGASPIDRKKWVVGQWQQMLTNILFEKYSELLTRSEKAADTLGK